MNTRFALLAMAAWASTAGGAADSRAGWTGLVDASQRCYYAVPRTWKTSEDTESDTWRESYAPDGSVTVVVAWADALNWFGYVAMLKSTLRPTALAETPDRLSFEYTTPTPGVHRYAAVKASGGACAMYLDMLPRAAAEARAAAAQVLDTLAALR